MDKPSHLRAAWTNSAILTATAVIALVILIQVALPDFPGTSTPSMIFFAALAFATVANLFMIMARLLSRARNDSAPKPWMIVVASSRVGFSWATVILLLTAVAGSIIDHELARPLLRLLVVALLLGAFWFMATSAVLVSLPLLRRRR
jgi:hypothetical protein